MRQVRLLQIGDIHYPDAKMETFQDVKDPGFPRALTDLVVAQPLRMVMRAVGSLCDKGVDGILFCGDLTSIGKIDGYRECIEYLNKALKLSTPGKWPVEHLHAVPGNHDVNRALCDVNGHDLFHKFAPLDSAWSEQNIPVLCTKNSRSTEIISKSNSRASVFSLNSCLGCGEKRYLPEGIQSEMKAFLSRSTEHLDQDRAFKLIGEELDTPAFAADDIGSVCDAIEALHQRIMPVVLAHHNLLPQTIPRISIYTEVINAGLIRSRLLGCNRPVLYCHGHVHDNPIEIVRVPTKNSGTLICISAPMLTRGYNLLTIEYSRNGDPIGCIVTYYGLQNDGSATSGVERRVSLCGLTTAEKLLHEDTSAILPLLTTAFVRFNDVFNRVRSYVREMQAKTLCHSLLEAEWIGLVEIYNREEDHIYWQIRRINT